MKMTGLIFFGDSIFAGTGASERELGCAKLVKSALSIPVSMRGKNWDTSQDGLARLENDVLSQKNLSHVVILFGNNDSWLVGPHQSKVLLETFRDNLLLMVECISQNGQTPMLCNLQPIESRRFCALFPEILKYQQGMRCEPHEFQKKYSDEIIRIASENNILFINVREPLEGRIEEIIAPDGIHPNDKGHGLIAAAVLRKMKQFDSALVVTNDLNADLNISRSLK